MILLQKHQNYTAGRLPGKKIILYGSYKDGNPREDSDIDLIVISENFKEMDLRERLEILGLAASKIFEPIEALCYTEEKGRNKKETILEEILQNL